MTIRSIIGTFKKVTGKITRTAQMILLPVLLTLLYFVGFGLFAIVGRFIERDLAKKDRLGENTDWHRPQLAGRLPQDFQRQS